VGGQEAGTKKDLKMKRIPLTKGQFAIVDDKDFEWLGQWNWYAQNVGSSFYAARRERRSESRTRRGLLYMHRAILFPDKGMLVDHVNHNTLDNRRGNLRICSHVGNARNRRPSTGSLTKCVRQHPETKRWRAEITVQDIGIHIGFYRKRREALRAYDAAASVVFGEFAFKNLPNDTVDLSLIRRHIMERLLSFGEPNK
jgi:hypothetical protein